jgi:hypothetical protein
MSRWDGGRGDLGQSAGGGSSVPRCTLEAPDPDIIMRRLATSERTMTPAMASKRLRRDFTTKADRSNTELAIICQPRSHRLHNPDQFRRGERYRFAGSGPKGT